MFDVSAAPCLFLHFKRHLCFPCGFFISVVGLSFVLLDLLYAFKATGNGY